METILSLLIICLITYIAYIKNSLSGSGAMMALFVGAIISLANGFEFIAVLLTFFISSSLLSKWKLSMKQKLEEDLYDKTGRRDWQQVLANGAVGTVCAFFYWLEPSTSLSFAFYASFAAANADTWASEIGVLSKKQPISIIRWKPIEKGLSGGVSLLGLGASALGAMLIGLIYLVFTNDLMGFIWLILIGFMGSILDSVLGAVLQPVYHNKSKDVLTEKASDSTQQYEKVKGISWFTNDVVNVTCVVIAAVMGWYVKS
ncbi:DUF92 domain-containing protein [Risungbinella massiliensis]|uniref:DUF92 domain-containing protein n=1 Tax=Risungbinella massiliensis TaxID=1329796 RepID=UPI0005CBEFD4|nr:DUF92 domain-containing protein [Risungbinella massiliensis]